MARIQSKPIEVFAPEAPLVAPAAPEAARSQIEVSFVMPCLNEAETLAGCIQAALQCARENDLLAEVVIADNGSSDGSQQIAVANGARLIPVVTKGYGNALRGGIESALGQFIVMADSDLSYDFGAAMPFIERLRQGYDLVMGSRFKGRIMHGAMPFKHRYLGNPVLSWLGRVLFRCPVSDLHCGLRAFSRDAYRRMNVRTTGMEFASEMVIKATLTNMRITEVPITLHKDGRSRPPHLRSWRDGWRHLRFMMCLSPRWTLFLPGALLMTLGLLVGAPVAFGAVHIGPVGLDINTLITACLAVLVGYMWVTTAIAMRVFGLTTEIGPPSPTLQRAFHIFTLERGLLAGTGATILGLALIAWLTGRWAAGGFSGLDPRASVRVTVCGATLVALGVQTMLMSLVYSMLGMRQDGTLPPQ